MEFTTIITTIPRRVKHFLAMISYCRLFSNLVYSNKNSNACEERRLHDPRLYKYIKTGWQKKSGSLILTATDINVKHARNAEEGQASGIPPKSRSRYTTRLWTDKSEQYKVRNGPAVVIQGAADVPLRFAAVRMFIRDIARNYTCRIRRREWFAGNIEDAHISTRVDIRFL
jgi:hypothetical protein